jgi:hypothetical protein
MQHLDPDEKDPEDRREVNPPIEVESATWSAGGTLDWWVASAVSTDINGGSKLLIFVL